MDTRAQLLLVVGSTGAGKSTFARQLARQHGGVCFIIDEWMTRLYGPDRPDDAGYDWYAPRIERCTEGIFQVASDLAGVGVPAVLEIGLTDRAARQQFCERVQRAGLRLKLYALEAPAEVRWQRVVARNHERGPTFALTVTREMFDFVESLWEAPDDAELAAQGGERIVTSTTT